MFLKHVGKHGDKQVAIVYRTVPGEEHMCLVVYPELLQSALHHDLMKALESVPAQQAENLADVLFRTVSSGGRPILQLLHAESKLKKVRTNQVVVTPSANSHVKLDELNTILDQIAAGGAGAAKLAELDQNRGFIDPVEKRKDAAAIARAGDDTLDDTLLGQERLVQSQKMAAEAKSLVTEAKRLEKEAFDLNPSLKPKRIRKTKATVQ